MTIRLISCGAIEWPMGYDYLIAAYARLKSAGLPFQARIVGTGALIPEMRFSILDMGLTGWVTLEASAAVPDLSGALLVIAAHRDHDSIRPALHVALDRGIPVVTTAFDGHPSAAPGVTVVPRRDVRALTAALTEAIARMEPV